MIGLAVARRYGRGARRRLPNGRRARVRDPPGDCGDRHLPASLPHLRRPRQGECVARGGRRLGRERRCGVRGLASEGVRDGHAGRLQDGLQRAVPVPRPRGALGGQARGIPPFGGRSPDDPRRDPVVLHGPELRPLGGLRPHRAHLRVPARQDPQGARLRPSGSFSMRTKITSIPAARARSTARSVRCAIAPVTAGSTSPLRAK